MTEKPQKGTVETRARKLQAWNESIRVTYKWVTLKIAIETLQAINKAREGTSMSQNALVSAAVKKYMAKKQKEKR